ncbi:DNA polymerase I, partial [Klebsiella pneumoniae]|nr:DNA polymerase I [Klebsiella pneumoniae]
SLTSQDDQLGTANYHTVLTQEAWDQLWQRMQNADHFAIDTETTSLDYRIAEMVGFSIAFDAKDAYYVPLAHNYENAPQQLDREQVLAQIKPILENEAVKKIGHHLKYDAHIFA